VWEISSDAGVYVRQGDSLYDSKRYEEAIRYYDKALEANLNDANVLYKKGKALYRLGKFRDAVQSLEKAKQLGLDNPYLLNNN
jgi:tetratricopeptide (TPR) repeat protein